MTKMDSVNGKTSCLGTTLGVNLYAHDIIHCMLLLILLDYSRMKFMVKTTPATVPCIVVSYLEATK